MKALLVCILAIFLQGCIFSSSEDENNPVVEIQTFEPTTGPQEVSPVDIAGTENPEGEEQEEITPEAPSYDLCGALYVDGKYNNRYVIQAEGRKHVLSNISKDVLHQLINAYEVEFPLIRSYKTCANGRIERIEGEFDLLEISELHINEIIDHPVKMPINLDYTQKICGELKFEILYNILEEERVSTMILTSFTDEAKYTLMKIEDIKEIDHFITSNLLPTGGTNPITGETTYMMNDNAKPDEELTNPEVYHLRKKLLSAKNKTLNVCVYANEEANNNHYFKLRSLKYFRLSESLIVK